MAGGFKVAGSGFRGLSVANDERIKRPLAGCCQQLSCTQVSALYAVLIYNCNIYILDRPGYPEVRHC